jgi:diacylglycerol kinase (ATP)
MRAAAILGPGSSERDLRPFQENSTTEWMLGLPARPGAADAVIVLGGDGTIHRHLGALAALGTPVLAVPCGSGNDFARALGIPRPKVALECWRAFLSGGANVQTIDLGTIQPEEPGTKRYFCCVAGIGLDAEVARRANRLPSWLRRHGGYALALPLALLKFSPPLLYLTADSPQPRPSDPSPRSTMLAVFANTPVFGDGMRIAPQARLDDGQLDACLIPAISKLRLLRLFPRVYSGRHLQVAGVEYRRAARFHVATGAPAEVYADGELVCRTPVEIGVAPRALQVIAPA